MKYLVCFLAFLPFLACNNSTETSEQAANEIKKVSWKAVDGIDIADFNKDLEPGKPTVDVAVYFPSNFDPAFKKVTLARMIEGIQAAKAIYKPTGVQINLLWVKTGELNTEYFSIQANEVPGIPETEYANTYVNMRRHPSELPKRTIDAFSSIIEPDEHNSKTIYLIALQDVFYPFLEVSEGRNWMIKMVRTGGMSFPGYSYCNTLPDNFRGIITITNLVRPDRYRRTVAHEIGHKVMNVGHEIGRAHV